MQHLLFTVYLSLFTQTFTDIDECSLGECDQNAKCINVPGGFYCECIAGNLVDLNPLKLVYELHQKTVQIGIVLFEIKECDTFILRMLCMS